jgi:hypothetical protein
MNDSELPHFSFAIENVIWFLVLGTKGPKKSTPTPTSSVKSKISHEIFKNKLQRYRSVHKKNWKCLTYNNMLDPI